MPNIVSWNEEHTAALSQLKQTLSVATDRMLYVADFERPFHIRVDASDGSVAGYIRQPGDDGNDCPLAFFQYEIKWAAKVMGSSAQGGVCGYCSLQEIS